MNPLFDFTDSLIAFLRKGNGAIPERDQAVEMIRQVFIEHGQNPDKIKELAWNTFKYRFYTKKYALRLLNRFWNENKANVAELYLISSSLRGGSPPEGGSHEGARG